MKPSPYQGNALQINKKRNISKLKTAGGTSMDWEYNEIQNEYSLMSGQNKVAGIQIKPIKDSENIKVKTIVDVVYYGYQKQMAMEKKNKDWVCYRKKIKEKDLQNYVEVKKVFVKKFIESREKEA